MVKSATWSNGPYWSYRSDQLNGAQPPISTVGQHGGATTVVMGAPVWLFAPATWLVTRACGRPPVKTVRLPITIEPVQTAPETMSPTTAAGNPPMSTVGTPGPVITSPVTVKSLTLAAGKDMATQS
jgi:hypothetical protein